MWRKISVWQIEVHLQSDLMSHVLHVSQRIRLQSYTERHSLDTQYSEKIKPYSTRDHASVLQDIVRACAVCTVAIDC